MNDIQLTQDSIELLEGFLMNHFRPFSCYFEGVNDTIKEFETDPDYGKTIKTIFETVLFSDNKDNTNNQSSYKCYVPLAEGKLTHILRQSANWYVRSDAEALRKLALIYEDTLEEVQIAPHAKVINTSTDTLTKDTSVLLHLHLTQPNHNITKQEKWLATNILDGNIKLVADELESHYTQNLSITKDAFLTQVGVSFGIAVLSSVLAITTVNSKEKQQLKQAIGKFCKHYKRHEIHTVLETALQMMYALDDTDKTIATDDITLILYHACQELSDEDMHQLGLYDWFDLIFDGEALSSNVVKFAPLIYQWIILDVLPSATQKKLPSYILVFEECIPTETYLHTLANE